MIEPLLDDPKMAEVIEAREVAMAPPERPVQRNPFGDMPEYELF
jgi:hypothetical protein